MIDVKRPYWMQRQAVPFKCMTCVLILQGDVGCGKTVVAFMALLIAVGSGYQGALLAPTEVLVEQHMRKLSKLVDDLPQVYTCPC